MERLRALYRTWETMREHLSADSVDDATIRSRIGGDFMQFGREWCPHTATAAEVYNRLSTQDKRDQPWVVVATAHPAKFNEIVEPIIGRPVAFRRASPTIAHAAHGWICRPRSRH